MIYLAYEEYLSIFGLPENRSKLWNTLQNEAMRQPKLNPSVDVTLFLVVAVRGGDSL